MADEVNPITSSAPKPDTLVSTAAAENKRDTSGDQVVTVRALKIFHKNGDMRGEMTSPGEEFEAERSRAAQLRANGLIEYVNETDGHAIHGEVDAKRIDEKVALQAKAGAIPANSKTTPLRNPEVKLADVKDTK
jgi:hypothetical protein